eukprot:4453176-Pyramimonas_sp.AAC.1
MGVYQVSLHFLRIYTVNVKAAKSSSELPQASLSCSVIRPASICSWLSGYAIESISCIHMRVCESVRGPYSPGASEPG